ncbi:hypothetical protein CRYUN_Cryun20dG0062800 [Craigia yunnanensis]
MGLPRKNPHVFKPSFTLPPKLRSLVQVEDAHSKWDDKASVIQNYKSFGVVFNPNFLGIRSRTSHIVESDSLQVPHPPSSDQHADEFEPIDSGVDLEEDGRLIEKYSDDYQAMFMDAKLNKMQHSIATLEKLCNRYHKFGDKHPLILPS